jgi:hypothetical protein
MRRQACSCCRASACHTGGDDLPGYRRRSRLLVRDGQRDGHPGTGDGNRRRLRLGLYGSIAGVAAACATGARAVAPVAAAGAYVAFGGYAPLLWLMAAGAVVAALSARVANESRAARFNNQR